MPQISGVAIDPDLCPNHSYYRRTRPREQAAEKGQERSSGMGYVHVLLRSGHAQNSASVRSADMWLSMADCSISRRRMRSSQAKYGPGKVDRPTRHGPSFGFFGHSRCESPWTRIRRPVGTLVAQFGDWNFVPIALADQPGVPIGSEECPPHFIRAGGAFSRTVSGPELRRENDGRFTSPEIGGPE